MILTEQDIINTYNKRQQEQCRLYSEYNKIKKENPIYGYKRIAKLLNQPIGKTRWWHAKKHIPIPIQTIDFLKERGLIPLTLENPKLPLLSKVLGSTFGDGGIFQNLNAIFLSSSELEAVKEFGEDLKQIFGNEIQFNSRIIEGGVYGHSWCYQNTNRNIIRLFQALGAPIGKKSKMELKIPTWIFLKEEISDEFFGAFFGGEINIPKIHINKTHLDTLSIGITASPDLDNNRVQFLNIIKEYLKMKNIITGSISKSKNKGNKNSIIFKLLISTKLSNLINFKNNTKIHYCKYKKEKLQNTLSEFIEVKKRRLNDLKLLGYKEEGALNLLKINKNLIE